MQAKTPRVGTLRFSPKALLRSDSRAFKSEGREPGSACPPGPSMPSRPQRSGALPRAAMGFILLGALACGESEVAPTGPNPEAPVTDTCAPDPEVRHEWNDSRSANFARRFGAAHHSIQGVVLRQGQVGIVEGKFAYGIISKDLEGELVRPFLRRGECAWEELAPAITDNDGRARVALPAFDAPGNYDVMMIVGGDHTSARGTITVLEENADVVIFDIDGTLTTDDGEVFEQTLLGATAMMHPGAAEVVQHYAARGIQPLFVTGRPYPLQGPTLRWLESQQVPPGALRTTDSFVSTIPGQPVQDFKEAYLRELQTAGYRIVAAYGNATSDICAYARAGVASESLYIIGPHAGAACEDHEPSQAIPGYPEHLEELRRGDDS